MNDEDKRIEILRLQLGILRMQRASFAERIIDAIPLFLIGLMIGLLIGGFR
jgi:hypothetical protein